MMLWALFCQWRWRRHVAAAERWERRYQAARVELTAPVVDDARRHRR